MQPRTVLLTLLVITLVVVTLAVQQGLCLYAGASPHSRVALGFGIVFADLGLLATWFTYSRTNIALRALGLVVGGAFLGYLASRLDRPLSAAAWSSAPVLEFAGSWVGFLALLSLVMAVPQFAARFWTDWRHRSSRTTTIWGILSLTTAVAIMLGFGRHLRIPDLRWQEIGLAGLATAIIPWVAIAIWRTKCRTSFAVVGYLAASIASTLLFAAARIPGDLTFWSRMAFAHGVVTASAYFVVQIADRSSTMPRDGRGVEAPPELPITIEDVREEIRLALIRT